MDLSRIVEEIIKQAIQRGEFENLPGKGKPIELETPNPFESKEETLLNKMLKNAGILPIEVQILKEIEGVTQRLEDCGGDGEKHSLKKKLRELELKYAVQMDARKNFFNS